MTTQEQVEHWIERYSGLLDSEIRVFMAGWKTSAPGYIAGDLILKNRSDHIRLGGSGDSPLWQGRSRAFHTGPLSVLSLQILDFIWQHYLKHGSWPETQVVHSKFDSAQVIEAIKAMPNTLLLENEYSDGTVYELRIAGVLMTAGGLRYADLLAHYIGLLLQHHRTDPSNTTLSSADAARELGLDEEKVGLLGKLIKIATLFSSFTVNVTGSWTAVAPRLLGDYGTNKDPSSVLMTLIKESQAHLPDSLIAVRRAKPVPEFDDELGTQMSESFDDPLKRRYQVFVSSTYTDLIEERRTVMQALLQSKCIPIGMELFPASNESQMDLIKGLIDNSDYYILVLAGRYGSIPEQGKLSFTEMEYDYAISSKKCVLTFCHRDVNALPPEHRESDPKIILALDQFRKKVRANRVSPAWENRHELGSLVKTAIWHAIENNPQPGWVRASAPLQKSVTKSG